MRVLLLCSNPEELATFSQAFRRSRFQVVAVQELNSVLAGWGERSADGIIVIAYGGNYLRTIRRLRKVARVPIVLLVEPLREEEHIAVLDAGGDLVLYRPHSVYLLIKQVRTFLKRAATAPLLASSTIEQSEVQLMPETRTVQVSKQKPRRLSPLEFRLLLALMLNPGRVFAADELVERVWGYTGEGNKDLVRKLVWRLRVKVEADPGNPQYITTVPGIGYTFADD